MFFLSHKGNGAPDFGMIRISIANASMKILLDECVPWPMHKLLVSHECATVQKCGWGGIKAGQEGAWVALKPLSH